MRRRKITPEAGQAPPVELETDSASPPGSAGMVMDLRSRIGPGSAGAFTRAVASASRTQTPASDNPSRSRDLSIELAAATDELNDALLRAEKKLAGLKLGVTASIELNRSEEGGIIWVRFLTFGKQSDQWRLVVESGPEDDPRSWSTSPVVNTSRETRLCAARHLPDLVATMHRVAEAQIAEVKQAVSGIDTLLVTLDKTRTP